MATSPVKKQDEVIVFSTINTEQIKKIFERDGNGHLKNHLYVRSNQLYLKAKEKYGFVERFWRFLGRAESSPKVVARHLKTAYELEAKKDVALDKIDNALIKEVFIQIFQTTHTRTWWQILRRPAAIITPVNSLAAKVAERLNNVINNCFTYSVNTQKRTSSRLSLENAKVKETVKNLESGFTPGFHQLIKNTFAIVAKTYAILNDITNKAIPTINRFEKRCQFNLTLKDFVADSFAKPKKDEAFDAIALANLILNLPLNVRTKLDEVYEKARLIDTLKSDLYNFKNHTGVDPDLTKLDEKTKADAEKLIRDFKSYKRCTEIATPLRNIPATTLLENESFKDNATLIIKAKEARAELIRLKFVDLAPTEAQIQALEQVSIDRTAQLEKHVQELTQNSLDVPASLTTYSPDAAKAFLATLAKDTEEYNRLNTVLEPYLNARDTELEKLFIAAMEKIEGQIPGTIMLASCGSTIARNDHSDEKTLLDLLEKGSTRHTGLSEALNRYDNICDDVPQFTTLAEAVSVIAYPKSGRIVDVTPTKVLDILNSVYKEPLKHPELKKHLEINPDLRKHLHDYILVNSDPTEELLNNVATLSLIESETPDILTKIVKDVRDNNVDVDFATLEAFNSLFFEYKKSDAYIQSWNVVEKWIAIILENKQEQVKSSHLTYFDDLQWEKDKLQKSILKVISMLNYMFMNAQFMSPETVDELCKVIQTKFDTFKPYFEWEKVSDTFDAKEINLQIAQLGAQIPNHRNHKELLPFIKQLKDITGLNGSLK